MFFVGIVEFYKSIKKKQNKLDLQKKITFDLFSSNSNFLNNSFALYQFVCCNFFRFIMWSDKKKRDFKILHYWLGPVAGQFYYIY